MILLVYEELCRLAAQKLEREKNSTRLEPTGLVHEVYLRLEASSARRLWKNRAHFFAAAAEAMRRILIDQARNQGRIKRGGNSDRVDLSRVEFAQITPEVLLLELDELVDQLELVNENSAALVKLRFFSGFSQRESAELLGIPRRSADRYWSLARDFLVDQLGFESSDLDESEI